MKLFGSKQALIVQAKENAGKQGSLKKEGVTEFRVQDGFLHGLSRTGKIVLVCHMADVSLASIEDADPASRFNPKWPPVPPIPQHFRTEDSHA